MLLRLWECLKYTTSLSDVSNASVVLAMMYCKFVMCNKYFGSKRWFVYMALVKMRGLEA